MKTAVNLVGEITEAPFVAPQGQRATVHYEVTPGGFISIGLGADGLVIHQSGVGIGIPLKDLAELAGRLEPKLAELIPPPLEERQASRN